MNDLIVTESPKQEKKETTFVYLQKELDFITRLAKLTNETFFNSKCDPVIFTFQKLQGIYGCATAKPIYKDSKMQYYQITIDPTNAKINNSLAAVIDTVIHEMIHIYCRAVNIKETSNGGRYHNERFKVLAEKCGLKCQRFPVYGWNSLNELSPALIDLLQKTFDESSMQTLFEIAINAHKDPKTGHAVADAVDGENSDAPASSTPSENRNLTAYICPVCGAKARAGKNANLICGTCYDEDGSIVRMEKVTK